MHSNKPNILFLSKNWYANLFKKINSSHFNSFHIANNTKDKQNLLKEGVNVVACFEEEYDILPISKFPSNYLISSYYGDRTLGQFTIEQRNTHLGKTISFFNEIFKNNNYTFIVHETVATEFDEVFSKIAKTHNVIDLTFIHSIIDNHFFWKSSPFSSSLNQKRLDNITPTQSDINLAKHYIDEVSNNGHNPEYIAKVSDNMSDISRIPKWRLILSLLKIEVKHYLSSSVKPDIHEYMFNYSIQLINNYNNQIKNWLDFYSWHINKYNNLKELENKRYLFFPLHFEPEATLLYFSPNFSEQKMVIQEILKVLPLDTVLVVKEHPQQKGKLINSIFGELKKRNSNLFVLPAKFNTHLLIKNALATITISGTTGYESIINKKPTFVFGNVFYDKHPQVIKIKSFEQLGKILLDKSYEEIIPQSENNLEYTAKIIASSKKGFPNYRLLQNSTENAKNLQRAIEEEVLKYIEMDTSYYIGV